MSVTDYQINAAVELAKKYGINKLLLFGSALTDPENAKDLDLGIEGLEGMKFFEFGGILENLIKIPVDIVDLTFEDRFIRYIKKTGKFIYDSSGKTN